MKLFPADPDIKTVLDRIENAEIKLQPDFQRGEVWSLTKKKRLVDSILRNWYVPPIHLIELNSMVLEVLDGQQRLAAIRDFCNDLLTIDGSIEPFDERIYKMDGMKFSHLDGLSKRKFLSFTLRFLTITDYKPEEPSELFFRLNQPTNLTSAEQRNAFYGPARDQVKGLVSIFDSLKLSKESLGFTNSRMAYDDVISKLCLALEVGTLRKRINASEIADKFRSKEKFSDKNLFRIKQTLELLSACSNHFYFRNKFSKATLFSWLCFLLEIENKVKGHIDPDKIGDFISTFELVRSSFKAPVTGGLFSRVPTISLEKYQNLFLLFSQRASSGSSDVSAVLTRDVIIWIIFYDYSMQLKLNLHFNAEVKHAFNEVKYNEGNISSKIDLFIEHSYWGNKI